MAHRFPRARSIPQRLPRKITCLHRWLQWQEAWDKCQFWTPHEVITILRLGPHMVCNYATTIWILEGPRQIGGAKNNNDTCSRIVFGHAQFSMHAIFGHVNFRHTVILDTCQFWTEARFEQKQKTGGRTRGAKSTRSDEQHKTQAEESQ